MKWSVGSLCQYKLTVMSWWHELFIYIFWMNIYTAAFDNNNFIGLAFILCYGYGLYCVILVKIHIAKTKTFVILIEFRWRWWNLAWTKGLNSWFGNVSLDQIALGINFKVNFRWQFCSGARMLGEHNCIALYFELQSSVYWMRELTFCNDFIKQI